MPLGHYGFFEVSQAEGHVFESRHDQKFFVQIFFRLCETFFANISKGSTLHFFVYFAKKMDVKKLPKGPILHVSALCDLRVTKKIFEKFQKNRIFPQTGTVEEKT